MVGLGRGVVGLGTACVALSGARGVRGWGRAGVASVHVSVFAGWRGGAGLWGWAWGDVPRARASLLRRLEGPPASV